MSRTAAEQRNREYMRARAARLKTAGLCPDCARVKTKDAQRCETCREKHRLQCRARYARLKTKSRCVDCEEPVEGRVYCSECVKRRTEDVDET